MEDNDATFRLEWDMFRLEMCTKTVREIANKIPKDESLLRFAQSEYISFTLLFPFTSRERMLSILVYENA